MRWALVCLLAGCGRIDFDPHDPQAPPECGPLAMAGTPYASAEEPFLVCTEAQLDAIGEHPEHWASSFRLGADLDLTVAPPAIGTMTTPFTGAFDGGGHTIAHLTIDQPTVDNLGLFPYTDEGARFSNLALTGVDIHGHNTVGALAGSMVGLAIDHITVEGQIVASRSVGGVAGVVVCTVCDPMTASNVDVTIDLEATGQNTGGVFGVLSPPTAFTGLVQLVALSSSGTVTGNAGIGGLVGDCEDFDMSQSTSDALVSLQTGDGGGLIGNGYGANSIIETSSASGEVRCPSGACGGLAATMTGTIANSHSSADITVCTGECGGLAGEVDLRVIQSYATGNVNATSDAVGGLVALPFGDILDSYATGNVTGRDFVGGLVGEVTSALIITRVYATGSVTGRAWVGGLGGLVGAAGQNVDTSTSFATGHVAGSTSANTVSPVYGALLMGGVNEVYATNDCTNTMGTCSPNGILVADPTQFYSSTNPPLMYWDFAATWVEVPGGYPQLR